MLLVRSCRTFAPLPVPHPEPVGVRGAIGGVFLWHFPHGYPHWALPSKPGHWGARTFLSAAHIGMWQHRGCLASFPHLLYDLSVERDVVSAGSNNYGAVAQLDRAGLS